MHYATTKRPVCAVCGLETFRHKGWFLVFENRWLDRLKILSWHSALAAQPNMRSICCKQHLKTITEHWLTQASLRLPETYSEAMPVHNAWNVDPDLGPDSIGHLVGELAVHRESLSRVWSGSPAALECILDALIAIGAENDTQALEFRLFDPPESSHGLSLQ
jgi:hypothetical protein